MHVRRCIDRMPVSLSEDRRLLGDEQKTPEWQDVNHAAEAGTPPSLAAGGGQTDWGAGCPRRQMMLEEPDLTDVPPWAAAAARRDLPSRGNGLKPRVRCLGRFQLLLAAGRLSISRPDDRRGAGMRGPIGLHIAHRGRQQPALASRTPSFFRRSYLPVSGQLPHPRFVSHPNMPARLQLARGSTPERACCPRSGA